MATSTALILIAGMSIVTYLTRLPLVFFSIRNRPLPPLVDRILDRIPTAAFAAIVFPGVLQPGGDTDLSASNLYVYAAVVTTAACVLLRRSLLASLLLGVATATVLRVLTG